MKNKITLGLSYASEYAEYEYHFGLIKK